MDFTFVLEVEQHKGACESNTLLVEAIKYSNYVLTCVLKVLMRQFCP